MNAILKSTSLVKLTKSEADEFMRKYEHLGNTGLGVWHLGLKCKNKLLGVVSYGPTCFSVKRGWLASIAQKEGCSLIQLCRGGTAYDAPRGLASHLISLSNKILYKNKGHLLIVAYADTSLCEIGTIYQACSAIYTGMTNPKAQANYIIEGRKMSGWQVRKRYGTREQSKLFEMDKNMQVLPLHKKHRYVMLAASPLKAHMLRKLLDPYMQPYPKREKDGIEEMSVVGKDSAS